MSASSTGVARRLRAVRRLLAVLSALGLASTAAVANAAPARARGAHARLTSPAFAPGAMIPTGFTCDGQDVPPPLRWSGLPAATVELALTVEDPDASRRGFVHWVAWGIDPTSSGLPEGVVPAGVHEGRNGAGRDSYLGPCPPAGSDAHRYRFTLYALRQPLRLTLGATIGQLRSAIHGQVLARAQLVGRYAR
jgi:Raf kinase inhibitor-like YbhB/YbcL family protein